VVAFTPGGVGWWIGLRHETPGLIRNLGMQELPVIKTSARDSVFAGIAIDGYGQLPEGKVQLTVRVPVVPVATCRNLFEHLSRKQPVPTGRP
jgi:hypothetical protein